MEPQGTGKQFQEANKIYNISSITNATFGVETQNRPLTDILTRHLLQAIVPYSADAASICEAEAEWYNIPEYMVVAKESLTKCFGGVLGNRITTLIAIEKGPEPAENKRELHINTCMSTAKRTLQVLCIILISDLWNQKKQKNIPLSESQTKSLQVFFGSFVEMKLTAYCTLLIDLYALYQDQKLDWPVRDLSLCAQQMKSGSDFAAACAKLEGIFNGKTYTSESCIEIETHLAVILCVFNFLAAYKMISIKKAGYEKVRDTSELYMHKYIEINNSTGNKENFKMGKPASTNSILLCYGDDDLNGVNLFPFIIDMNALNSEGGTKIYFYNRFDKLKNMIDFRFLNDGTTSEEVTFSDTLASSADINKLMEDDKASRKIKLDTVYLQFMEAKKTILG